MQHLALLVRFLLIERKNKIVDIRNEDVVEYIVSEKQQNGIGNYDLEKEAYAKRVLQNLNLFYEVFKDDPTVQDGSPIPELRIEYFIISVYLLLRHLRTYYVFDKTEKRLFHDFVVSFHERWRSQRQTDTDILLFSNSRQQSTSETELRDRIIRQAFFEFIDQHRHKMLTKDQRRIFNEAERIAIYRRDDGLCQQCLAENKTEKEALVPWTKYQADHVIPHSKGGVTDMSNAQVLCGYHNQQKGAR